MTLDCSLCRHSVNHLDGQIFTPPYLLNADGTAATRPTIMAAPTSATPGDTLPISTDVPIAAASIIRRGCVRDAIG